MSTLFKMAVCGEIIDIHFLLCFFLVSIFITINIYYFYNQEKLIFKYVIRKLYFLNLKSLL